MDDLNAQVNAQDGTQTRVKSKSRFSIPKLIFFGLGAILLVELVYAVGVLVRPASLLPVATRIPIQAQVGKIVLNAPQTVYRVNQIIPVTATIYTGSKLIDGVDLLIRYDPKVLDATSGGLVKGRILEEYPTMSVDASKGLISISGISSAQNSFQGTDQFAVINFKAKAAGKTSLTIDFKSRGSTTDSNLVEASTSKDILDQVTNLELIVQ